MFKMPIHYVFVLDAYLSVPVLVGGRWFEQKAFICLALLQSFLTYANYLPFCFTSYGTYPPSFTPVSVFLVCIGALLQSSLFFKEPLFIF